MRIGLTVFPDMWAINSQGGRSLEQVQCVLLCNDRTVIAQEKRKPRMAEGFPVKHLSASVYER